MIVEVCHSPEYQGADGEVVARWWASVCLGDRYWAAEDGNVWRAIAMVIESMLGVLDPTAVLVVKSIDEGAGIITLDSADR